MLKGMFSLGIDGKGAVKLGKSAILAGIGVAALKMANSAGLIPESMVVDQQTALEWGAILCAALTWGSNVIRKLIFKYPPAQGQA